VSRLIREHNDQNKRPPFLITHESFDALEKQEARKLSYSGYVERLLLLLAGATSYPGLQSSPVALEVLAARAELPGLVVAQILTQMREQGHFMVVNGEYDSYVVRLLPAGWARVDELQASRPRSDRAFVAMWLDKSMTEAYADGIESALLACGYEKPFRVDDIAHQAEADKPGFQLKIDDRMNFDTRQKEHILWADPGDLKTKLETKIRARGWDRR